MEFQGGQIPNTSSTVYSAHCNCKSAAPVEPVPPILQGEIVKAVGELTGLLLDPHFSNLSTPCQVPFATVDDEDFVASTVRPLLGKRVRLSITPGGVSLQAAGAASSSEEQGSQHGEVNENGTSSGKKDQSAREL